MADDYASASWQPLFNSPLMNTQTPNLTEVGSTLYLGYVSTIGTNQPVVISHGASGSWSTPIGTLTDPDYSGETSPIVAAVDVNGTETPYVAFNEIDLQGLAKRSMGLSRNCNCHTGSR